MDYKQAITETLKTTKKGLDRTTLQSRLRIEDQTAFTAFMKDLNALEAAWIIYHEPSDRYILAEYAGLIKGVLKLNAKGFGFVENETQSIYVNQNHIHDALQDDTVMARMWQNFDESQECEIIHVLEHAVTTIVGTVKMNERGTYFLPDVYMHDRKIKITNYEDFKLVNDSKVLVHIDSYSNVLKASILKVLGHKYDPGIDILSVLLAHNIEPGFPKVVMDEVQKIPDRVMEADFKGRRDLRDQIIITIDGADSRDLDDAVSVEKIKDGYRLGVHIADVSYYVREGSAVNAEAFERATSVYVVDRVVPMLPHSLSNGICSLNPKVDRLTISCVMDINKSGEVFNYEIFPSVIRTTERMTYRDVNGILAGDEKLVKKYSHILPLCMNMEILSKGIRKRRHQLGAIDFDTREAKILVNEKGKPTDVVVMERGEAERIIEDFMIAANECVARHVKWLDTPSIYRVHEEPDAKKIRDFAQIAAVMGHPFKGKAQSVYPKQIQEFLEEAKDSEDYPVLSTYMLRSMQKARYDASCLGHFGLGLQEYTHFTSPIRRYPDLIVHRMLRKYCFDHESDAVKMRRDEEWIIDAAVHCSKQERVAIETERDVDDMKKAEYMEQFIGKCYDGVISSVMRFGMFVELDNTVEGLIHISNMTDDYYEYDEVGRALIARRSKKRYVMGQKVRVKVLDASRFKKQVDFILMERGKSHEKNGKTVSGTASGRNAGRMSKQGKGYREKGSDTKNGRKKTGQRRKR